MTTIKITELTDIGANLASSSLVPVVNMAGVPVTQKTNIGNIANIILAGAGVDYPEATVALLAQTVSNAAQPNITSVGTLTTLAVSGNTSVNGNLTSNGTAYVGNLSTTGIASITTLAVGATANLGAVGNVTITGGTAGQVLSTDGAGNLSWASDATSYGNSNVANYLPTFTGNIGANVVTANLFSGNGTNLTNIAGANVSGFVANANVANTAFAVAAANVSGLGNIATINLTGSTSNVLYGNGVFAPVAGGANTGNVTFDDINIIGTGNLNLQPDPANVSSYLDIFISSGPDIHIVASQSANLILGKDEQANVMTSWDGDVYIQSWDTNTNTQGGVWAFGGDGTTTFPTANVDLHNGGVQSAEVLQFGNPNLQSIITGPTPSANVNAQRLIVQGQRGNGTGEGGDVYVWAGDADINGGDIKIYAGDADNASAGSGGYINLAGGDGFDNGGDITLNGGYSANGYGGQISITGGQGQIDGGPASITGGYATAGNGGAVNITGGTSSVGPSAYGNVEIGSGIYGWSFNNEGNLVLPGNTFAVNYANGTQVPLGGGGANTGNVTFDDNIVIGTGDEFGGAGLFLATGPNGVANLQYLQVRGGDFPTHIHLDTGNNEYYDQYFGADSRYVKLEANGNVVINADDYNGNSGTWTFDTTGNLNTAGDIVGPANANFTIYSNAAAHEFIFADDGTFYAPDNVVLGGDAIYIGPGANTLTGIEHEVFIASSNHFAYVQGVINNVSDNGSAEWVALGAKGDDSGGWGEIGFTSSGFGDANYTITGAGDGYVFAQAYAPGSLAPAVGGGNLVLATGNQGTTKDIIFGTGGFLTGNIFGRISHANNSLELSRTGATITFPDSTEQNTAWTGSVTRIANGNSNVSVPTSSDNVYINVNGGSSKQWIFDTAGNLRTPGNVDIYGAINFPQQVSSINWSTYNIELSQYGRINTNVDFFANANTIGALYLKGDGSNISNIAVANVVGLGNIATANLTGSNTNVLYGNGVFAAVAGGSGAAISNGTSNVSVVAADGNVVIGVDNDAASWTFATDGNIYALPETDLILVVADPNGDGYAVKQSVTDGTTELSRTSLEDGQFSIYTNLDGAAEEWRFNGNTLQVSTNSTVRGFDSNVVVQAMFAGTSGTASLQSVSNQNDPNIFTTIDATTTGANISVYDGGSNSGVGYTWQFDNNGRLTFPGTPRIDTSTNNFEVQAAEAINFEANTVVNIYTDAGNNAYQWQFGDDGNLTTPGNLVIAGNTSVFGTNASLLQTTDNRPLLALSSGANGAVSSLWVEDVANVGTSNIAAVYANPTIGSGIVRIAVGQNGGNAGPNLWDFGTDGNLTIPGTSGGFIKTVSNASIGIAAMDNGTNNPAQLLSINAGSGAATSIVSAYATNATIQTNATGTLNTWQFDNTGNLTLPTGGQIIVSGGLVSSGASPAPTINGFSITNSVGISGNGNIAGNNISATGNVSGSNLSTAGTITANGGAYGEVVTTQFASVWGQGAGPNPYSVMQVRSSDGTSGLGMQAFTGSGTLYGNTNINFGLATIRDKDVPSGLVIKAYIDSTGFIANGIVSASGNVTGGNIITGGVVSATGNVSGNFFLGNGSQLTGITATSLVNGTSNVVTTNNGNVTIGIAGNAAIATFTGTGANVTGTLDVTGNVTAQGVGTNLVRRANTISGSNTAVTLDNLNAYVGGTPKRLYIGAATSNMTMAGQSQTMSTGALAVSSWINVPIVTGTGNGFAMSGAITNDGDTAVLNVTDQGAGSGTWRVTGMIANTSANLYSVSIERLA